MLKGLTVVLAAAAAAASVDKKITVEFDAFKAIYKKSYETEAEHDLRFEIFRQNYINASVLQAANPLVSDPLPSEIPIVFTCFQKSQF